jgi:hypothetical protein
MSRVSCKITILLLIAAVLPGCAASPWSSRASSETKPAAAASTAPGAATSPASQTAAGHADSQALQQVMAELQQVGAIDPAAQEKLLADLRETDPALWPLVLRQFRAAAAYRRQAEQREAQATASQANPDANRADSPRFMPQRSAADSMAARPQDIQQPTAANGGGTPPSAASSPAGDTAADSSAETPPRPFRPATRTIAIAKPKTKSSTVPSGEKPELLQVAYQTSEPGGTADSLQWQANLAAAIRGIEAQTHGGGQSDGDVALQARLRMLYLLAGRRDDAMQPIATATPAAQDYWSKQIYGLATWLDTDRMPDAARRSAETKRILAEAMARLGETAPLTVANLAFCTAVQSYGSVQPFKKNEFTPDQEVLLYAEVDNFVSTPTPKGYYTSLKSDCQIFDSRGQRIAEHDFAAIEEYCQNPRRDYFIGHRLRMPKRAASGKYTLQLTVEDTKSHKVGQATVEFAIKDEG